MRDFIKDILFQYFPNDYLYIYENSPLIKYLDSKMGAVYVNSKTRRNLANIYAIYSILFYFIIIKIFLIILKNIETLKAMNIIS